MTTEYMVASPEASKEPANTPVMRTIRLEEAAGQDQLIAARTTSGYVISYSMADSLAKLRSYFEKTLRLHAITMGDKGHSMPRQGRSLVVLGGPLANRYLEDHLRDFAHEYPLLSQFRWTVAANNVELTLPDGETLTPSVDKSENGTDFAFVANFILDPMINQRIVIIAGCHMWATEAATRFLLDPARLRSLPKVRNRNHSGFAFVLRTRVSDGEPERIDVVRRGDGSILYHL